MSTNATVPNPPTCEALRAEFLADLDQQFAMIDRPTDKGERWWIDVDGLLLLRLRFKGTSLKVNGEADTAILHSLDEVRIVLLTVLKAVLLGRLDESLRRTAAGITHQ